MSLPLRLTASHGHRVGQRAALGGVQKAGQFLFSQGPALPPRVGPLVGHRDGQQRVVGQPPGADAPVDERDARLPV